MTYITAATAFVVAAVGQVLWIRLADKKSKKRLANASHAGGIVFRNDRGEVEYLLVGPSKEKSKSKQEWLFPKGHIDPGEQEWWTALREVKEESGIKSLPISAVGSELFELEKERVKVKYYLMKYDTEVPRKETRRIGWFNLKTALKKLTYRRSRKLLREAERQRAKLKDSV